MPVCGTWESLCFRMIDRVIMDLQILNLCMVKETAWPCKKRKAERDKVECPSLLGDRHGLVRMKI